MACEENVEANELPCEFTGRISCKRGSGPSGFPSLVVSGGENDGDTTEIVITFAAVMPKDVISVNDFIKCISFEPSLLDEVDVKGLRFHHSNEMLVPCIVVWCIRY